jgi:hypothetical protein
VFFLHVPPGPSSFSYTYWLTLAKAKTLRGTDIDADLSSYHEVIETKFVLEGVRHSNAGRPCANYDRIHGRQMRGGYGVGNRRMLRSTSWDGVIARSKGDAKSFI